MRRPAAASPLSPDRKNRLNCLGHSPARGAACRNSPSSPKAKRLLSRLTEGAATESCTLHTSKNLHRRNRVAKRRIFERTVRREQLSSKRRAGGAARNPPLVRAVGRLAPPALDLESSPRACSRDAELPTQSDPGCHLFLHGELARPPLRPAGGADRRASRSSARRAPAIALPHRRLGRIAGPYALPVDPSRGRQRLPRPLAKNQNRVLQIVARSRMGYCEPDFAKANSAFGSAATGNTRSTMIAITRLTWITSTSTR